MSKVHLLLALLFYHFIADFGTNNYMMSAGIFLSCTQFAVICHVETSCKSFVTCCKDMLQKLCNMQQMLCSMLQQVATAAVAAMEAVYLLLNYPTTCCIRCCTAAAVAV
mmetsp:Transcript_20393/g.38151  ORF Transcript_20393/g.38151 Transcript_20393/m.38151 type:complete len:109 (-) Transcript_20393:73-399(-)